MAQEPITALALFYQLRDALEHEAAQLTTAELAELRREMGWLAVKVDQALIAKVTRHAEDQAGRLYRQRTGK
jgi:hypothetical protein